MKTISVVIPTCDRIEFLKESVHCVLKQSYPPHEIIVVNNGQTPLEEDLLPNTVTILELPPYIGVAYARNHGAAFASGDYIAFLDDDDLWEKDYIKKVIQLINKNEPDCIITRLDKLEGGKITSYKNADGKLNYSNLFILNPGIGGQTTIVQRLAFTDVKGYDENLPPSEDKSLIIDFLLNGYKVITAPDIQAILRIHKGSRLRDSENMQNGIINFIKKYRSYMTAAQKNFNWLKYYRHRHRLNKGLMTYIQFNLRFFLHIMFKLTNHKLPHVPYF
jgi:GT2 family glycosyltransferase